MCAYFDSCDTIVNGLKNADVNFVALDFDLTFVNLHSCADGGWQGSSEELRRHVRPIFEAFVPLAIEKSIHVAVVTFSPRTSLVRDVLTTTFGDGIASQIPVRGRDFTWSYEGSGCKEGKQSYMASAAEFLKGKHKTEITRGSTLLIDDDSDNVKTALKNGVRAVRYIPDEDDTFIGDMMSLFGVQAVPSSPT